MVPHKANQYSDYALGAANLWPDPLLQASLAAVDLLYRR